MDLTKFSEFATYKLIFMRVGHYLRVTWLLIELGENSVFSRDLRQSQIICYIVVLKVLIFNTYFQHY